MDQEGSIGKSILDRLEGSCGGFCPGKRGCAFGGRLQEVVQGLEGLDTARNKTVVRVNQARNSLNLRCVRGKGSPGWLAPCPPP